MGMNRIKLHTKHIQKVHPREREVPKKKGEILRREREEREREREEITAATAATATTTTPYSNSIFTSLSHTWSILCTWWDLQLLSDHKFIPNMDGGHIHGTVVPVKEGRGFTG